MLSCKRRAAGGLRFAARRTFSFALLHTTFDYVRTASMYYLARLTRHVAARHAHHVSRTAPSTERTPGVHAPARGRSADWSN